MIKAKFELNKFIPNIYEDVMSYTNINLNQIKCIERQYY